MAKQTFTAGQVLTAAEMNSLQENDYNWTVTTKTASYTLAAGDEGTRIVMDNAGATTITVDDAVFSAGDVVWLHNIGAGTCTVTAGTATVNTAASLDLAQWEGGSLFFTSASSAIFFRGPAAGVGTANFTDTETGTYSSGGVNYKYITFTSSGTITFDTDGLATCLIVGAGGGGGRNIGATYPGGGGGAGQVLEDDFYFTAGTYTVTVGAGGAAGGGAADRTQGKMGYTSEIGKYISTPGGGGEGVYTYNASPGASGGGGVAVNAKTTGNPPFSSATGNAGANGQSTNGGGGGGAGGGTTTSTGGVGLASTITGSSVTYGKGGNGVGGGSGAANTGDGGNGNIGTAGAGGSGIVIVRVEV